MISQIVVKEIEAQIDILSIYLPELENFILPRGNNNVTLAHICRCCCGEAEILFVDLSQQANFSDWDIIQYLNRLEDYFFILARYIAYKTGNAACAYKDKSLSEYYMKQWSGT